jgi:hypothetical protein
MQFKREEARLPLLFLDNKDNQAASYTTQLFQLLTPFFALSFFSGSQTNPCFQKKNSGGSKTLNHDVNHGLFVSILRILEENTF